MGRINSSVELPAAPRKVWDEFADPANFEKWLTIHTKWKGEVPTEFEEGAQISEVITMLGMANTITWTVREYDPPRRLVISGTGMAGVKITFSLLVEENGAGCTAGIDAEFEGQMIVGALGKAVEKDGKKNLDQSLDQFRQLLA